MKSALIRFARVIGGAGLAAVIAAALGYAPILSVDLDGTAYGGFVVIGGAALTALDKYLRDSGVYGGQAAGNP